MRHIWAIAWKDIYLRFTDRTLLLIMIAAPLAVSVIVGLAFGGLGRDQSPVQGIPVAVLNLDQGSPLGFNFGQVYLDVIAASESVQRALPECPLPAGSTQEADGAGASSLEGLLAPTDFNLSLARGLIQSGEIEPPTAPEGEPTFLEQAVKQAVDNGIYHAAVILPPGLSQTLANLESPAEASEPVQVYVNAGRPLNGGIVLGVVEGVTNQLISGNITIAATFSELASRYGAAAAGDLAANLDYGVTFGCAFSPRRNSAVLQAQSLAQAAQADPGSLLLVSVGSAQAMFFALFIAQFGILGMHEEKRNWTLQRMLTTATRRASIFAGKLVGVWVSVVFQLAILFLALSLVGSLLAGKPTSIWGGNPFLIGAVMLAAAIAVSGLGMLLAGIVKTPEQAAVIGSVLNMALAILGGAFGFFLPQQLSRLSILYWGRDAFEKLASGNTAIGLNALVLLVFGVITFAAGLWLFNRRFEV